MRTIPAAVLVFVIVMGVVSDASAGWGPLVTKTPTVGPVVPTATRTRTGTATSTRTATPTNTPTIAAASDAFQLRYAANLAVGDSVVNLTNAGTRAGSNPEGNICANVYVFAPDETMVACCSCDVSPNGLKSYSARNDLIANTISPGVPTSIIVKLLATTKTAAACDPASPTTANLAPGLRAWGTTIHSLPTSPVSYGVTETEFSQAVLSGSELSQLTATCATVKGAGAVCNSCRLGGL